MRKYLMVFFVFSRLIPKQIWQGDKCQFSHDVVPRTKSMVLAILQICSVIFFFPRSCNKNQEKLTRSCIGFEIAAM